MKVLFISSGRKGIVNELVKNQGDSLVMEGVNVRYFTVSPGIKGYLKSIFLLRKHLGKNQYDLIHAHYSLSAFVASLAYNGPLVVSLLGSDVFQSVFHRWLIKIFHKHRWEKTIVKTEQMSNKLKINDVEIIPNGVNLERFKHIPKKIAREKIGYPLKRKLIIFVSDPLRVEKNYDLAVKTLSVLDDENTDLLPVYNVSNELIPYYMNASDVLLLTSTHEGSVNVVKEAMACNIPIVSTDVGDVKKNTINLKSCIICKPDPVSLSEGIKIAYKLTAITSARERIRELELDSVSVAHRIIKIYKQVMAHEG